eukprot:gene21775-28793_t
MPSSRDNSKGMGPTSSRQRTSPRPPSDITAATGEHQLPTSSQPATSQQSAPKLLKVSSQVGNLDPYSLQKLGVAASGKQKDVWAVLAVASGPTSRGLVFGQHPSSDFVSGVNALQLVLSYKVVPVDKFAVEYPEEHEEILRGSMHAMLKYQHDNRICGRTVVICSNDPMVPVLCLPRPCADPRPKMTPDLMQNPGNLDFVP